ncbi:MAG TPA: zinc ribbon domain-containing protein [Brevefilum sp.]|nr:zinc ribbon domain-containing protein [Brevefilum sp.]HOR19595.1 zinc ribbon domain-containing protein [Brevefilum sp.]HPL70258.1 zinc ribbon domain-containing protein [Brevefilum sp.]
MLVLICSECGAENPLGAKKCELCGAPLEGIVPVDLPRDDQPDSPGDEEHLTDLLHSLKQDDDQDQLFDGADGEISPSPEHDEILEDTEQPDDEPHVPEWLHRIRQRAQTEPDSIGEITQKINAARESLETAQKEDQEQQLQSVLQKIQDEVEQKPPDQDPDEIEDSEEISTPGSVHENWLRRIRRKHRPAEAEDATEILSEREGDSLLHWLVALENGEQTMDELVEEAPVDDAGRAEDTKETAISRGSEQATREIILDDIKGTQLEAMALSISREEQARADQLAATMRSDKEKRPVQISDKPAFNRGLRLGIGFLLITILSLVLFMGRPGERVSGVAAPHVRDMAEWVGGLQEESMVLLVMDYSAAFSGEMTLIATPILRGIFEAGAEVSTLSSAPAGRLLFDHLVEEETLIDQRVVTDLGYYPVGSFGAYGLAHQTLPGENEPESALTLPVKPFDVILILGDDYEGVMAWIEQIKGLKPDVPILLLLSAQAGPLLQPYWESGQVAGMISGIADAVNLEGQNAVSSIHWFAYRVGIVLMILMLVIGMSFPSSREPLGDDGGER